MSALSIRHMNFTLQAMEHIEAQRSAEEYAKLPADRERTHYWFVERKAKRGNKWIVIRDFRGTKSEAAELFVKRYRNRTDKFRLRHILEY